MQKRTLGRRGPEVPAIGYGAMGPSHVYGPAAGRGQPAALGRPAAERGVTP